VEAWWGVKSLSNVGTDGIFSGTLGASTNDIYASKVACFLVNIYENGNFNTLSNYEYLGMAWMNRSSLGSASPQSDIAFFQIFNREVIQWKGFTWWKQYLADQTSPGNNYFSGLSQYVYVDSNNLLHLTITLNGQTSYCTMFKNFKYLGYGSYLWTTVSRIDLLDDNAVLSMSLYDTTSEALTGNSEVDMTVTNWGEEHTNMSSNYEAVSTKDYSTEKVYSLPNLADVYHSANLTSYYVTFVTVWQPTYIYFSTWIGSLATPKTWVYGWVAVLEVLRDRRWV
jgi:hypothetical protein